MICFFIIIVLFLLVLSVVMGVAMFIGKLCLFPIMVIAKIVGFGLKVVRYVCFAIYDVAEYVYKAYCRWFDKHYAYRKNFGNMIIQ